MLLDWKTAVGCSRSPERFVAATIGLFHLLVLRPWVPLRLRSWERAARGASRHGLLDALGEH